MQIKNRKIAAGVGTLLIGAMIVGAGSGHWLSQATAYAANTTPATTSLMAVPGPAALAATQQSLAELYSKVSPSVVNIQVKLQTSDGQGQDPNSPFNFPFPFGQQGDPNAPDLQAQPQLAEGSGFVYDNQGHIVTNNHVVADASEIVVNFANGQWAKAELVARDPQADLAVIKVTPPKGMSLEPLKLANDNELQVGYMVAAIGSPFDLAETLTSGIVSAIGRSFPTGDGTGPSYSLPDVIQTDAAINPGNSGGPLLDMNGAVVGVNFAINSPIRANSGVGFSIPISVVRKVVPALIEKGKYEYSYLGLSGQTINSLIADEKKWDNSVQGVYVADVTSGGPADKAGVQADDVVTAIDNQSIHSFEDLLSYLFSSTKPEQKAVLQILRNGEEKQLEVVLGVRPSEQQTLQKASNEGTAQLLPASKAITVAKQAVQDAGLINKIDSFNAHHATVDQKPAWIVKIGGEGKNAIVTVDAQTGEVIDMTVQK